MERLFAKYMQRCYFVRPLRYLKKPKSVTNVKELEDVTQNWGGLLVSGFLITNSQLDLSWSCSFGQSVCLQVHHSPHHALLSCAPPPLATYITCPSPRRYWSLQPANDHRRTG